MENNDFIELKTKDNSVVYFRKSHISAIEEITTKKFDENFVKIYLSGYSFSVLASAEEVFEKIKNTTS